MQVDFSISINFKCLSSLRRKYLLIIIKFSLDEIFYIRRESFSFQSFHTFISLIINEYRYSFSSIVQSPRISFYLHIFLTRASTSFQNERKCVSNRESSLNDLDNSSPIHYRDTTLKNYLRNRSRANER